MADLKAVDPKEQPKEAKRSYFGGLIDTFGWRFVVFCILIYGVNQSIALTFGGTARTFYMQDSIEDGGLELTTLESQKVLMFSRIPWQIKSVFGIASDAFAIRCYHRKYYLVFAALCGAIGWGLMGLFPSPTNGAVILYLTFTNLAVAFPDVLIDGSVAIKCQKYPKMAVDLQSLLWGALGVGGVIAAACAGFVYEAIGARPMFLIVACIPLLIGICAFLNWIDDQPDPDAPELRKKFFVILYRGVFGGHKAEEDDRAVVSQSQRSIPGFTETETDIITGRLYILAAILCVVAIAVGAIGNTLSADQVIEWSVIWLLSIIVVSTSLWIFTKGISKNLATTAIYIFLKGAVQPHSTLLVYWQRTQKLNCCQSSLDPSDPDDVFPDYCSDSQSGAFLDYDLLPNQLHRPCLSDAFLSYKDIGAYVMLTAGVILYNKFLSGYSYRSIWTFSTLAFLAISFFDLIWVWRWNLSIGLNDKFFMIFGTEILATVIDRFDSMPFFILAAKLCPPGVEGTLFAMLMGLSNFGSDMGGYLGTVIQSWVGVTYPTFEGLDTYIIIRNCFKVIPLFMIPILVPSGGPLDESEFAEPEDEIEVTEKGVPVRGLNEKDVPVGKEIEMVKVGEVSAVGSEYYDDVIISEVASIASKQ